MPNVLRDRLNAQLMAAETTEARAAALRDRLDAMQAQLAEAHSALQAAAETERRAVSAEASRETERGHADALRDRFEAMREQLTARQEVVDAAEAIRQADDQPPRARPLGAAQAGVAGGVSIVDKPSPAPSIL